MYTVQEGIIQKCVWNLIPDRCVHLWQSFIENSRNDFMKRYSRQPTASFKGFAQLLSVLMDETHLSVVSPLLRLSPREESSERETVCYRWLEKLDTHRFKREWTVWTELTSIYKTSFQPGLRGKHEVIAKRQIVHVCWHKTQFLFWPARLSNARQREVYFLSGAYVYPTS